MTLQAGQIEAAGRRLLEAQSAGRQVEALSLQYPEAELDDAYAIQAVQARLRTEAGDTVRGYKIGLTDSRAQQAYAAVEPVFGRLHDSGFDHRPLIEPLLEAEIAFVIGRRCAGPDVGVEQVLAAVDSIRPAFEIIDSRMHGGTRSIVDLVSDNAAAARVVMSAQPLTEDVDLLDLTVHLRRDGKVVEVGSSTRVLGHPATALTWLVNALALQGQELQPGDIVMSGSCTKPVPFVAGEYYEADFGLLGSISLGA